MESLLGTFLAAGAAGGIAYLILHGIRALFGDESGPHDPNGLNSTDQDGRKSGYWSDRRWGGIEVRAKNLRPIQALDGVLAQTWEGALALLSRELGIETVDLTLDQQVRFTHGIIHAILTLLPDRDLPVMAPNPFSSR